MRRTRHVVLPVRSWQYIGLMVVSLACLTLGLVSRDREGKSGSLTGPEMKHTAPHEVDSCPNAHHFIDGSASADDSRTLERRTVSRRTARDVRATLENRRLTRSLARSPDSRESTEREARSIRREDSRVRMRVVRQNPQEIRAAERRVRASSESRDVRRSVERRLRVAEGFSTRRIDASRGDYRRDTTRTTSDSDRRRVTRGNDHLALLGNAKTSGTFELMKQSVIWTLCIAYTASLVRSKSGFINNLVPQLPRLLVG